MLFLYQNDKLLVVFFYAILALFKVCIRISILYSC